MSYERVKIIERLEDKRKRCMELVHELEAAEFQKHERVNGDPETAWRRLSEAYMPIRRMMDGDDAFNATAMHGYASTLKDAAVRYAQAQKPFKAVTGTSTRNVAQKCLDMIAFLKSSDSDTISVTEMKDLGIFSLLKA